MPCVRNKHKSRGLPTHGSPRQENERKVIVVLSVIFGIILFAGIGLYVWYSNLPFPTVVKLADAVKERDVETMMECIEPDTAQKIRLIMDFTGFTLDDILNQAMPDQMESGADRETTSLRLSVYSRDGDRALIHFSSADTEGEK